MFPLVPFTISSKYDAVEEAVGDFSLMFFHTEQFPYTVIQTACSSDWSHIGMIFFFTDEEIELIKNLKRKYDENPEGFYDGSGHRTASISKTFKRKEPYNIGKAYILESTTDDYPCAITGKSDAGVKICSLYERLSAWSTGLCGIKKACYESKRGVLVKTIIVHVMLPELLGIPYEKNLLRLFKAWLHYVTPCLCYHSLNYDEASMFCTELMAHLLRNFGVLNTYHSSHNINALLFDLPKNVFGPEEKDRKSRAPNISFRIVNNNGETKSHILTIPISQTSKPRITDEDMVLEDFVYIDKYVNPGSWLVYEPLNRIIYSSP
jgi:hypothetical protein